MAERPKINLANAPRRAIVGFALKYAKSYFCNVPVIVEGIVGVLLLRFVFVRSSDNCLYKNTNGNMKNTVDEKGLRVPTTNSNT